MIRKWIRAFTGAEREEYLPVALMGTYGFLAMTSYYLIKPARNSVFVDRVGADNLPYVYILTAVLVTVVVLVYSRYVDRIGERTLLLGTFAFLTAGQVFFWWILLGDTSFWSSGGFYIWGKLYPLLLVSQFWLVGNLVFTTRQARRLFGIIGVGLILGGIAGSAITGAFASVIGTEYLLLVAGGFLILCAGLCASLFPFLRTDEEASGRLLDELSGDAVRILFRSGHLRSIAAILALTILVGTLLDWELNRAVELSIESEDAMTRFWGLFFMVLNIASVTIQLFVTGVVLRRWGVGVAILALPVGLLIATMGVLAVPVLATAALAKGAEGALRYSLDQSTREVLYLPVPAETKYKVKPLIDLAVYRMGTGFGGIILLVAVTWAGLGIREVAAITLVMIGAWIAVAMRMRREYVRSLAQSIRGRFASLDSAFASLAEAGVLEMVRRALTGKSRVRCAFALEMVDHATSEEARPLAPELLDVLDHDDPAIRAKAIRVLERMPGAVAEEALRRKLLDPDEEVRVAAVRALCAHRDGPTELIVRDLLSSEEGRLRRAVLSAVVRGEVEVDGRVAVGRAYVEERRDRLESGAREDRLELALAAGTLTEDGDAEAYLGPLLDDPDPDVAATAAWSAGRVRHDGLRRTLIRSLERPEGRQAARESLASQGPDAVPALVAALEDPESPAALRRQIPTVLERIPSQAAVDALFGTVEAGDADWLLEQRTLRALNRLRRRHGEELSFDGALATMIVRRQLEAAESYASARRTVERSRPTTEEASDAFTASKGLDLLGAALDEAWERRREAIFRCLALQHPPEGLYRCYVTLTAGGRGERDNALEWLEHALGRELFGELRPVLGGGNGDAADRPDGEAGGAGPSPPEDRSGPEIARLLYGLWHDDAPAVARAAVWTAARLGADDVGRRLEILEEDARSPGLGWLAARLRRRLEKGETAEDRELDEVERTLLLRGVDLFGEVAPTHLFLLAGIAEERRADAGEVLLLKNEPGESLYVVIRGRAALEVMGGGRFSAEAGRAFGTWALLDDRPSPLEAVVRDDARLLEIRRDAFRALLAEHPELAQSLLRGLGHKIRGLAA